MFEYILVLFEEFVFFLIINLDGIYVDVMFGFGGYLKRIFEKFFNKGFFVVIDKDLEVIEFGKRRLEGYKNIKIVYFLFLKVDEVFESLGIEKIDGIFFDFGVFFL